MSISAKLKKYGSILLVIFTFITLFFGWVSMKQVSYKGVVSSSDFVKGFEVMADYASYEGRPVDTIKVVRMSMKMLGDVKPGDLGYSLGVMTEIINNLEKTEFYYDSVISQTRIVSMLNSVKTLSFFINLFFYLSIAMALFSLFMNLANKKYFGFGLFISVVGLAISSIMTATTINDFLITEYEVTTAVTFASATAWPYISIILSAAAAILWLMYVKEAGYKLTANGTSIKAGFKSTFTDFSFGSGLAPNWICPNCAAAMSGANKYCAACGGPRPEPRKCPYCENILANDAAFCARCGGQYYEMQKCVSCNTVLNPGNMFCVNCGTQQPVYQQIAQPYPSEPEMPIQPEAPAQPEIQTAADESVEV